MISSPYCDGERRFSLFCRFIVIFQRQPIFPGAASRAVADCQPWFYQRLAAYSFFWLSEGA